jgi:hypothetical protein
VSEKENKTNNPIIPKLLNNAPEEVIKVYNEWKERYERLNLEENRYFVAQTPNNQSVMSIDLLQPMPNIKRQIKTLRGKVKELILKRVSVVQKERNILLNLKREWQNWQTKSGVVHIEPLETTIIELLGQFKTKDEIKKIIYDYYTIEITDHKINNIKVKYLDKIDKLKSEWEGSFDEFSVTRKRGRIERLVYLLQTQTAQYTTSNTFPVVRSVEIRAILEQIRKEIEGNKIEFDIKGNIDITASINMNMSIQQITQQVSINSFIVGLVAAKRGIDPTKLMHSLTNSYYKSLNGFTPGGENQELSYPSNLINSYDWNRIEELHKDGNREVEEAQIIEETPTPVAIDLKTKLLEIMSKKADGLEKTKNIIGKNKK